MHQLRNISDEDHAHQQSNRVSTMKTIRNLIYVIPGTRTCYRWVYRKLRAALRPWDEHRSAKALMRLGNEGRLLEDLSDEQRAYWERRIESAVSDPNNGYIPRHPMAGRIVGRWLVMHNGLRVDPLGHYGRPMLQLMIRNGGVHEPEEERAFQYVLEELPDQPVMIELGCYWAFYSMWFLQKNRTGRTFLIEPFPYCLESGKKNFRTNGFVGDFTLAGVGKLDVQGVPSVRLDDFARSRGLSHIDILHSDIQGAEYDMLLGASELLTNQRISFLFISTHSDDIHRQCSRLLMELLLRI